MIEYTPRHNAVRRGRDFRPYIETITASPAPTLDDMVMPVRLLLLLMTLLLLGPASNAIAQAPQRVAEPTLAPAELRADLQQLRTLLEKEHPAPYRYTSRERMGQWFDSAYSTLNAPMSARAFLACITTLYPLLADGHTMFLPADDGLQHRYLPIEVLLQDDGHGVKPTHPVTSTVADRISNRDAVMSMALRALRAAH